LTQWTRDRSGSSGKIQEARLTVDRVMLT
jgi:hypothetical protein